jgi:hypothetical protein
MYLFMIALTIAFVFIVTSGPVESVIPKLPYDPFSIYVNRVHQFSGLSPELYEKFLDNLQLFRETHQEEYLYKALSALEELSLHDVDGEFEEECYELVHGIGSIGEKITGTLHPKYL